MTLSDSVQASLANYEYGHGSDALILMQTRGKVITATLVVAVLAFMLAPQAPLGQAVWPAPKHDAQPTAGQVPFFMLLGVIEAVAMGVAVSFLLWGLPSTRRLAGNGRGLVVPLHLAIAWLFGNFWLHDNVHFINGMDLAGLLVIDYVFHVTLMASGMFVAWCVVRMARERESAPPQETPAAARNAAPR